MDRIAKRIVCMSAAGMACVLFVALHGCSQRGKRYITVAVDSDPPGAEVLALIDDELSGIAFSPWPLGPALQERRRCTLHLAL